MQAQLPCGRFDIVANDASLVRRKAIENQTHGLPTAMHQLAQQLDKPLAVQTTHVGAEPKLPARTHRRGGGDRLPLPRSVHNRSLAAQSPGLSMNGVGAKTGFIPKQNLCAVAFSLAGQRRIRLLLPQGYRLRISLIRTLQRLLWRQLQLRQQRADAGDSQINPELPLNQQRHDRARPQTEIQSVLPRIAAIDPPKDLSLLGRGQTTRPTSAARRTQRPQTVAASGGHVHPLVDRRAVESVGGDHDARILALAHPANRHQTNLFKGGMIKRAAVNFHHALYQQSRLFVPLYSTNLSTGE